ncbi:GMP/IMP nucleotidase [Thiolapillus brandeum]|uniref:HAD-superfamily hydrolase n=1 Tax=Thiolapillus brandeum TaxID=1076588 RepID=A0A7U6GGG0_9GAMM|nr:GMP/IMP nucleotidase [Thiolapillus brandeum]BAO43190.1 HAD-superfamily hydrolase [Thiolapillus brandeum]
MFDWSKIDTVLLDMDGTLLDLHFDNHFWLEHVPLRYAQKHGLSVDAARQELMKRYARVEGTLDWYCVDYWSRELALDISLLKSEVDHLIAVHPHVLDFLQLLGEAGKIRVLVTNAHQKALHLKMRKTRLGDYLDQIVSAHELGLPKENPVFWERLRQQLNFDPQRTLFIDDSLSVLRSAREYGISQLLCMLQPDASQPVRDIKEFASLQHFQPLLDELASVS